MINATFRRNRIIAVLDTGEEALLCIGWDVASCKDRARRIIWDVMQDVTPTRFLVQAWTGQENAGYWITIGKYFPKSRPDDDLSEELDEDVRSNLDRLREKIKTRRTVA